MNWNNDQKAYTPYALLFGFDLKHAHAHAHTVLRFICKVRGGGVVEDLEFWGEIR